MKTTRNYGSAVALWLLLVLSLVGVVHADIPGRDVPSGAVPNPGTQQQEMANLTFPAPFNSFEFTVTCGACHGGSVDQQVAHMGNWGGGNMASAARDPIFRANQIIVNNTLATLTGQDGAGNMCFRCHSPNGWYSGRFDPTMAGDPSGRSMMHSIVASTDDEGVMCETCHRAVGNVTYKRADLDPNDSVWNMIAGIFGWQHDGGPFVDQAGDPTIAPGNPYGDTSLQFLDGMTYVGPRSGISDAYFSDLPLEGTSYTGQIYAVYPPNWTGPMNPVPAGMPATNSVGQYIVYNLDGSIPPMFEAPVGPPIDPNTGMYDYMATAVSIEHPTVGSSGRRTSDTTTGLLPILPDGPGLSQTGGRMPGGNDFITTSEMCGSCHDLTVPVLNHGMPEQRTYTEWKFSSFSQDTHVGYDPIRKTNRPQGKERCQDCHMPKIKHEYSNDDSGSYNADPLLVGGFPYGKDRNAEGGTTVHKLTGANRDLPEMMKLLYPEVDMEVIGMPTGNDPRVFPGMLSNRDSMYDRAKRNTEITLRDGMDVAISQVPTVVTDANGVALVDANGNNIYEMKVKVTNKTGHRIPSGYPDGRRFWVQVQVNDGINIVYESGHYDPDVAKLYNDSNRISFQRSLSNVIDATDPLNNAVMVYERVTGSCDGVTCTPSSSLINDKILFDNRIPPAGFTYADYRMSGVKFWKYDPATMLPVEDVVLDPATNAIIDQRYPDGQNWDEVTYRFAAAPGAVLTASAETYWQTHTREFMEHLKDQDSSNLRPEGPPNILDPNYPMNPTYLSDVIGLAGMTDLDGNPLRDNWGGIAYAAWLKSDKGAPYRVDRDATDSVVPVTAPVVTAVPRVYISPATGAEMTEAYSAVISWTGVPEADGYVVWIRYGASDATSDWDRLAITDANTLTLENTVMNLGKTYGLKVEAFNGKGSIMSLPYEYMTPNDAPLAPQNLQLVSVTPTTVDLTWYDMADNEVQFEVWRFDAPTTSTVPQAAFLVPTQTGGAMGFGGNNWTDTTVAPGMCYNYQVRAIAASGSFSTWNAPAPVQACVPAGTVTPTATAVSEFLVTVDWSNTTFPDTSVNGYRIERSLMVNGPWAPLVVAAPADRSYSDSGVLPSTSYFYRIVVIGTNGATVLTTAPVAVTTPSPQPPAAPTGLTGSIPAGLMEVDLSWTDQASNEQGFSVERSVNNGPWNAITGTLPAIAGTGAQGSYIDTTVSGNTTYSYRVVAVNGGGTATSNVYTITTPNTAVTVAAPTNTTAVLRRANQVRVSWTNNANNATGFVIERSVNGSAFSVLATTTSTRRTRFDDASVSAGNSYAYQVRAVRLANGVTIQSAASNIATIDLIAPLAPTNLAGSIQPLARRGAPAAVLTWTNVDPNAPTVTIEQSRDNGVTWSNVGSMAVLGPDGAFVDMGRRNRGLRTGTYLYRVQAVNDIGGSPFSNVVTLIVP